MTSNTLLIKKKDGHDSLVLYISTGLIAFIFFISAIKFGSVVDVTGIGFYPLSLFEWLFSPWPPFLVPAFTGFSLFLAILCLFRSDHTLLNSHTLNMLMPVGTLLVISLLGLIQTTEIDYALLFVWHILAIFNFLLAVYIQTLVFPRSKQFFLICIVVGAIYSMSLGVIQVYSGFEETKKFAVIMEKEKGNKLSSAMKDRLSQTRAFASFTYPNSYAAHLILVIPLVLAFIWKWSRSFHPPLVSQIVLTSLTAVLSFSTLYFTGSRGSGLALIISIISIAIINRSQVSGWIKHNKGTFFFLLFGILLLLAALLLLATFKGRTLASAGARFDYYTAALKMFLFNPLYGVGLGEFFTWYLRLKPLGAEETRLAHNLFLHFLSQCGILGGFGAAYFLSQPILIYRLVKKNHLRVESPMVLHAVLLGCLAWGFHALTDFNVQIPGTMLIVTTLPLLVITPGDQKKICSHSLLRILKRIPKILGLNNCFFDVKDTKPTGGGLKSKLGLIMLTIMAGIGIGSLWRLPGERSYQMLYNQSLSQFDLKGFTNHAKLTAKLLPLSPYPWEILGKRALLKHNYELGEYAFREAVKRTPHRASYYSMLAQCLLFQGKLEQANESIDKALLWYPFKDELVRIKEYIQTHPTEYNRI